MIGKINNALLSGLLLVCLCACNKPSVHLALGELPGETVIKPGEMSDELIMFPPKVMHADSKGNLFFFTPDFEHSILIFNPRTNRQLHWGTMGGGQDDFNQPTCVSFSDDKLTLYAFNSRKMADYMYEVKSDNLQIQGEKYQTLKSDTMWIRDLKILDNGYYVGFDAVFSDYTYVLLDKDLKFIKRFGKPEIEGMHFKFNNVQMSVTGNLLFCGVVETGYMECFEIGNDATPHRLWSMKLNHPTLREDGANWDFESLRRGFYSVCSDQKHVYAIFSDRHFKETEEDDDILEHILIMNTDGIILKNIEIEGTHLCKLCVSGNKLYVLTGDFRVMELDIDDLI